MLRIIPAGTGFNVGVNFARAKRDILLTVAEERFPLTFGFIPAQPDSPLSFLQRGNMQEAIYVHVDSRLLREPFTCPLCGQRIDDGKPCGCGART
jgi:hypothetical protein